MSDEDFSEEQEDFSASEDEWTPGDKYDDDDSDEDATEDHQTTESPHLVKKEKNKRDSGASLNASKQNRKLKRKSARNNSLRAKMFKKYQPPPKVFRSSTVNINCPTTSKLSNTPHSNVKKNLNKTSNTKCQAQQIDSDSSSSGDDGLVNPNELDLKSSFFDVNIKKTRLSTSPPPNFDCDGGITLNNSEEEEDDDDLIDPDAENNTKLSTSESPFKKFYDFNNKVEEAKLKKYEIDQHNLVDNIGNNDIAKLLSMGEESKSSQTKNKKTVKNLIIAENDADSEWEKVEDYEHLDTTCKKEDGSIQITVEHSNQDRRQKKTVSDEEASLMRKLNRVIKENQIYKHKTSLLCQIAHGNFLNRVLNNENLLSEALKLLPNGNKCYPDGKTEIGYFEAISKWYSTKIKIKCYDISTNLNDKSTLLESLRSQIQNKEAFCKKSFVLIFIILLRAMGIQCRMVINLVTLPIRPPQEDLCSIKKKNVTSVTNKTEKKPPKLQKISSNKNLKPIESVKKEPEKIEPRIIQPSPVFDNVLEKVSTSRITRGSKKNLNVTNKSVAQTENKNNPNSSTKQEFDKKPEKRKLRERLIKSTDTETSLPPKVRILENNKTTKMGQENSSSLKSTDSAKLEQKPSTSRAPSPKFHISPFFIQNSSKNTQTKRTSTRKKLTLPQMDGGADIENLRKKKSIKKKLQKKMKKNEDTAQVSTSDDDFVDPPKINKTNKILDKVRIIDRRALSSDKDESPKSLIKKKNSVDIWIEVYSEKEDQWITLDIFHTKVHCVDSIRKQASSPISYVFAWNNDNSLKDVSARYCPEWNTVTRKNRIEKEWLDEAIQKYIGKKNARDVSEDQELDKIHLDKPLPKTINEFKNHPLYVLERHLLKFEVLYPPNAPTLGFVRGEPIYSRDCVHLCHSREIWLKEARVVKLGETAYKVVKARPKWDKFTNSIISNLPLDIFGYWQTMQYEPPTAENGIVPRNAYGNVELFKDCMLPKKTVHLRLPGLPRVCKKLKIDCAPAVIGFDFHQGSCHPMLDGFVVCEEFENEVVAAWTQEQEDMERREQEKYEQRVYGNWKKLIKGLYIRQKLKRKYNFEANDNEASVSNEKKKEK